MRPSKVKGEKWKGKNVESLRVEMLNEEKGRQKLMALEERARGSPDKLYSLFLKCGDSPAFEACLPPVAGVFD